MLRRVTAFGLGRVKIGGILPRRYSTQQRVSSAFYRHRYTIAYGAFLGGSLLALQLDLHRKLRFKSIPIFIKLASSEIPMIQQIGAFTLFRLSRDYKTAILMGKQGAIDTLANLIDQQLQNTSSLQGSTKYSFACLNNLSRYPPHKLDLISQEWLKRYQKTIEILQHLHNEEGVDTDTALLSYVCFLSTLSTYSRVETATALAYAGVKNWIEIARHIHDASKAKCRGITKILVKDQSCTSFSSPGTLLASLSPLGVYNIGTSFSRTDPKDYILMYSFVVIGELCRHKFARDKLVQDGVLDLFGDTKNLIDNDVASKILYIRALAFLCLNNSVREEVQQKWIHRINKWMENDDDSQVAFFVGALLLVLLENPQIGKKVVSVLGENKISEALQKCKSKLPEYFIKNAEVGDTPIQKKE